MSKNLQNRHRQEDSVYNSETPPKKAYVDQDSVAGKRDNINLSALVYRSIILVLVLVLGGLLIYSRTSKQSEEDASVSSQDATPTKEVSVVVHEESQTGASAPQSGFIVHDFTDFSPMEVPAQQPVELNINWIQQLAWHLSQGQRRYRWKEWRAALREYRQAERIKSDLPGLQDRMGLCHFWLGEYSEAIGYFEKALKIKPDSAGVYNNIGLTMLLMDNYDEAAEHLARAIELDENYSPAYFNLGLVRFRAGDMDGAANILRDFLVFEPENENAVNLFTQALMRADRWDEAVVVLRSSVIMMPGAVPLYFRLAEALVEQGEYAGAMAALERAIGMTDAKSGLTRLSQGGYDPIRRRPDFQKMIARLSQAL